MAGGYRNGRSRSMPAFGRAAGLPHARHIARSRWRCGGFPRRRSAPRFAAAQHDGRKHHVEFREDSLRDDARRCEPFAGGRGRDAVRGCARDQGRRAGRHRDRAMAPRLGMGPGRGIRRRRDPRRSARGSLLRSLLWGARLCGPSPGPVYGAAPGGDAVAYCMQRYRSYDPGSGTFLGYDGLRHPCP